MYSDWPQGSSSYDYSQFPVSGATSLVLLSGTELSAEAAYFIPTAHQAHVFSTASISVLFGTNIVSAPYSFSLFLKISFWLPLFLYFHAYLCPSYY